MRPVRAHRRLGRVRPRPLFYIVVIVLSAGLTQSVFWLIRPDPPQPILTTLQPSTRPDPVQASSPEPEIASPAVESDHRLAAVYRDIGSKWHQQIRSPAKELAPGRVEISFLLNPDGTIDHLRISHASPGSEALQALSLAAARDSAPFKPLPSGVPSSTGKDISISFTLE